MLRAVVDRILAALAVAFGIYLPDDAGPVTAALLVGMAAIDGWLRWRERSAIRELLGQAQLSHDNDNTVRLLRRARLLGWRDE